MQEEFLGEESLCENFMGENYVQEEFLGEESLGEESLGEKYVQEEFLGEESLGEKFVQEEFLGEEFLGEKYMGEKSAGEKSLGENRVRCWLSLPPSQVSHSQKSPSNLKNFQDSLYQQGTAWLLKSPTG